jgi:nitrogen fixation protein FixH
MTGRHVWWYFVAFFGFVVTVNVAMVTIALRTHSGLVTDHPYEKGLSYNKVVEAERKQQSLGWKGTVEYKNGALHFLLRDKNDQALIADNATASFTRPTQQGMDFAVELKGAETAIEFPAKGVWEVRVDTEVGDTHYQQIKRIIVP